MASSGRQVIMGCGHIGVAVIGQFYACSKPGCPGKPKCPQCETTTNVKEWQGSEMPEGSWECLTCKRAWFNPVPPCDDED